MQVFALSSTAVHILSSAIPALAGSDQIRSDQIILHLFQPH